MVYVTLGTPLSVDLGRLARQPLHAWWFDPREGQAKEIGTWANTGGPRRFIPPGVPGRGNDWVLVLDAAAKEPPPPGTSQWATTAESWSVLEQPELKQHLEAAPVLKTESLGEPARGVNVWERWMVPNLDGKSWDVLQLYFKEYRGPTWLYAFDLGTGEVKRQRLPNDYQFYLSGRALGPDGKYYIATPWYRTWSMHMFVYDPATNMVEDRGEIVPGLGGEVRPLAVGPDGRIYGTGTRGNRVGLYIYDPKLRKVVKDFGSVGPSHPNGAWSRYVMGVDDTHAYIASGMIPAWYLVAVNLQTGEQNVLLESPSERVIDIIERFTGAFARVPQVGGAPDKAYWLYHGQAILMTNSTPPWPAKTSPWDKAVPKPEVYYDQIDPDADGNAVLWHRSRADADRTRSPSAAGNPEAAGWKSVRLEGIPTYPHRINPLSVLPDGRLYGTGEDYVGTFIFDPKTDRPTYCGPRVGLAPYTTIACAGLLYLSGYPEMELAELKRFRQLGSRTPGHPEYRHAPGIETTTGPLGQGLGNAVGMALAERLLNRRYGDELVNHHTYCVAGDGDLMEGISQEAISLAGHLKLGRLIVLFDDNQISIDGPTSLSFTDDTLNRFRAYGWDVREIDGHNPQQIHTAIGYARTTDAPSLIACKTIIGYGAPNKQGKSSVSRLAPMRPGSAGLIVLRTNDIRKGTLVSRASQ